jgi:hypothetical protein
MELFVTFTFVRAAKNHYMSRIKEALSKLHPQIRKLSRFNSSAVPLSVY